MMNLIVLLFSQVDVQVKAADSIPVWAQIAGGVATAGFTAWYAWYTTTVTIPKLNDQHAKTIKETNEQHAATIEKTNEKNADLIGKIVNDFRSDSKEQRMAFNESSRDFSEIARASQTATTQVTRAVDDLRQAINQHVFKSNDRSN